MFKEMSKQLFDIQCKCGVLNEKERRLYEYAYNLLISRVGVYLLIVVCGIWMKNLKEIFVFLLAFTILRQYVGGIHLEKEESCVVISGILVCITGQYLRCLPDITIVTLVMWIVSSSLIFFLAPIECRHKKLDFTEYRVYKERSRFFLGIECLLIIFVWILGYLWIVKGIIAAQVILAMNLLLGWIKEKFILELKK